ncbi:MAG TPA: DUF72 domain-containing protein [Streptosporangiaceae bacterium]|nr:DUF72 domain-containing protein [Streptosporangiaceae bacterium]
MDRYLTGGQPRRPLMIRIGTSGWSYEHWHPELYASELRTRDRLARYADAFTTAELNSSFWQCEETFALLAAHHAAHCVMSGAHLPCVVRATTDFAYVRLHGPDDDHLYAGPTPTQT